MIGCPVSEGLPVSAIAIIFSALIAWRVQTWISVRRATIEFIAWHEVENKDWNHTKQVFLTITSGDDSAERMLALLNEKTRTDSQREEYLAIASFLNHFEAVAIAIKHGAMSGRIYKDWHHGAYIDAWKKSQSYINERRTRIDRKTLYRNFEDLAKKWEKQGPVREWRRFWNRD